MSYIAFDVETLNSANDRMSAIGVSVLENGAIVRAFYTSASVADAPRFLAASRTPDPLPRGGR